MLIVTYIHEMATPTYTISALWILGLLARWVVSVDGGLHSLLFNVGVTWLLQWPSCSHICVLL